MGAAVIRKMGIPFPSGTFKDWPEWAGRNQLLIFISDVDHVEK